MGRVVLITSGKGGVGKTTITASLGITLAKLNKSCCLVDGDLGLNNLDVALGLENRVVYDIFDVTQGKCRLSQAIIEDPFTRNLYFLPSANRDAMTSIAKEDFRRLILDLSRVFDFVLIDSPAGIDLGFERSILPAGEVLVVVNPTFSSIRDAGKVITKSKAEGKNQISLIINRIRLDLVKSGEMLSIKDIEGLLNVNSIGAILENDQLYLYGNVKYGFGSELDSTFKKLATNLIENKFISSDLKQLKEQCKSTKKFFKLLG